MSKAFLATILAWVSGTTLHAAIGIIELDTKSSEVRFAAVVAPSQEGVQLRVCTEPLRQWDNQCADSKIVSPPLPKAEWERRIKAHFGLPIENPESLQIKEQSVQWARARLREKLDRGTLDSTGKESAENALNAMLGVIDRESAEQRHKQQAHAVDTWLEWMSVPTTSGTFNDTLFQNSDPLLYEAALGPFATWLMQSICRCEHSVGAAPNGPTQCHLAKGNRVLARRNGALHDCQDRTACAGGDWDFDFDKITTSECGAYFTVGSLLPSLAVNSGEVNEKNEGVPHERKNHDP